MCADIKESFFVQTKEASVNIITEGKNIWVIDKQSNLLDKFKINYLYAFSTLPIKLSLLNVDSRKVVT